MMVIQYTGDFKAHLKPLSQNEKNILIFPSCADLKLPKGFE